MANPNIWAPGASISADSSIVVERFVASAAQTLFDITLFTYVANVGSLHVYVNGVYQVAGVDYTETSSSSFTLLEGVSDGTVVVAVGFIEIKSGSASAYAEAASQSAIASAASAAAAAAYADSVQGVFSDWQVAVFIGNGTTQAFPLPTIPSSAANCVVDISGVLQTPNVDFILTGTTIGFPTAPPAGTRITVRFGETLDSWSGIVSWGDIAGTITNQVDLTAAFAAKANSSHTHAAVDLSGVVKSVNGKSPDGSGAVTIAVGEAGTVTSVSVVSANGFSGSVANASTTPAITLATSVTGILYGDSGAVLPVTIGDNLTFVAGTLSATGGSVGSAAWGDITGTLADQTDLNTALSAKQATITAAGLLKGAGSGNVSAAVSGTDYVTPSGNEALTNKTINGLTLSGTNGTAMTFPAENASVGFRNMPQNSRSAAYTCVLADSGKHILHPSADTTARIFTIPENASVGYPIGTAITFVNQASAGVVTIAITTDTMRLAGAGTTGNRTLAANGIATALKLTTTEWIISGTGLT